MFNIGGIVISSLSRAAVLRAGERCRRCFDVSR